LRIAALLKGRRNGRAANTLDKHCLGNSITTSLLMGTAKLKVNNTIIDYEARKKLGLTINEYCIADFIYKSAADPSNNVAGWGFINGEKVGQIGAAVGLTRSTVYRSLQKLKAKKIIEFHPENKTLVRATILWSITTIGQLSQNATVVLKEKVTPKENNIYIPVSSKQDASSKNLMSCPLKNLSNPLKDKYPKAHAECVEYVTSFKFVNKAKQFRFLHQMLRAGLDFPDIDKLVNQLEKKPYFQENGYDFATIAGEADRRANAR
jgi:DNA-binding MarR family transcriptional regulator